MRTVTFLLVAVLFSSCYTPVAITKDGPIPDEVFSKLRSSKTYKFALKSGRTMKVYIEKIEADTISGYSFNEEKWGRKTTFSDTFKNLKMNVVGIRKCDPVLTAVAVIIPVGAFIVLLSLPFGPPSIAF